MAVIPAFRKLRKEKLAQGHPELHITLSQWMNE